MKREKLTAWVTKYALTTGIKQVEAELYSDISEGMIGYSGHHFSNEMVHGNDWHRTPEAALAQAEVMRKKKIATLEKQIKKLEKMVFVITGKEDVPHGHL